MRPFILAIIPARGGSKGIKNKNVRMLAGKPLIAYTIQEAKKCSLLSDVVVSTDSAVIARVAKRYGGHLPFMRPMGLATDKAKTVDVVIHAVKEYENIYDVSVSFVVVLQPTAPLRRSSDIQGALKLFLKNQDAQSLMSCYEATSVHPDIMYIKKNSRMIPLRKGRLVSQRQDFKQVFVRNGAIYIATKDLIFKTHCLIAEKPVGFVMPRERSLNIDEPFDLKLAGLLKKYG